MRLGSLCSGYGGLEAGIGQVLDIEPVWCSEIDKDASTVLATHHPSVPNLGDLTVLDWHQVPGVDLLCAGFPCQPFSHAGKRQGADDERAIFSYIADGISVLRPGLVVLENVPGILTLGGPAVIAALTALRYDCRWLVVRASDTGAPHRRARWFCIARNTDDSDIGAIARTWTRPSTEPAGTSRAAADASDFGHERAGGSRRRGVGSTNGSGAAADSGSERHGPGQDARRVGLLDRRDEGTARQRQRARGEPGNRGGTTAADASGAERRTSQHETVDKATRSAAEPGERDSTLAADADGAGRREQRRAVTMGTQLETAQRRSSRADYGPYGHAVERWERIIGRPAPDPTDDRGLRPEFVEWMMGLDQGYICDVGLSRTAALKMLGNGVVPQQAALAVDLLL